MPGMKCPRCKHLTLFETPTGKKCNNSDCQYTIYVPPNGGKGGRGKKCPICDTMTIFNGKCTKCGTREI